MVRVAWCSHGDPLAGVRLGMADQWRTATCNQYRGEKLDGLHQRPWPTCMHAWAVQLVCFGRQVVHGRRWRPFQRAISRDRHAQVAASSQIAMPGPPMSSSPPICSPPHLLPARHPAVCASQSCTAIDAPLARLPRTALYLLELHGEHKGPTMVIGIGKACRRWRLSRRRSCCMRQTHARRLWVDTAALLLASIALRPTTTPSALLRAPVLLRFATATLHIPFI